MTIHIAIKKTESRRIDAFWTVVLEKTLESPLDCKEIKPVHPKGDQSWIFIGRTDAEAETPILWPPDAKSWLIGKDPDAGNDWRREEKGMTEDEMVGWHHQLNGHQFEKAPEVGDGQGGLVCCSPEGHKELDTTEWLNWTDLSWIILLNVRREMQIKAVTFFSFFLGWQGIKRLGKSVVRGLRTEAFLGLMEMEL